jgi:hypothetical protein
MSKGPQIQRRVQRDPPRQGSGRWANDRASRRCRTPPTSSWQRSQSTQPKAAWNTFTGKIRVAVDQVTQRQAEQARARVPTRGLGLHPTHGPPRPNGRGGSSYSKKNAGVSPRIPNEGKRPLAGRICKRKSTLHQGRAHEQEPRRAPARPGDTSGTDPPPSPSCWGPRRRCTPPTVRRDLKVAAAPLHSHRTRASAREFPTKAAAARRPHPQSRLSKMHQGRAHE